MPPFLSRVNKKGGSIILNTQWSSDRFILKMFVKSRFDTYYLQDGTVCSVFSKLISKKYCLTIMDLSPQNFMGIVLTVDYWKKSEKYFLLVEFVDNDWVQTAKDICM